MKKMRRVVLIVLDACGIGELPDAAEYGDVGSEYPRGLLAADLISPSCRT